MFCQKCGNEFNENSVFCDQCGSKVETTDNINNDEGQADVSALQTAMANSNDIPNEVKRISKGKSIFISACAVFVATLIVLAFAFGDDSIDKDDDNISVEKTAISGEPMANDDDYISCAKTVVSKRLKAPSMAIYYDEKILAQDEYGRTIVYFTVESQNSYGGYVANNWYVLIESYNKSDNTFRHNKHTGVYMDDRSFDFMEDTIVNNLKESTDWGKPFQSEELEE